MRAARPRRPTGTAQVPADDRLDTLRRRARRLAGKGQHRKAALALRELAALRGDGATWALLGGALRRARREGEALEALRRSAYLHRQEGAPARARAVARLIVALDPHDAKARRLMDRAA